MSEREIERVPCVDDLCTGTINAGGSCNYCGKPGPIPSPVSADAMDVTQGESATSPASEPHSPDHPSQAEASPCDNPDDRIPCTDDLCTGTLDAAGVCRYCGLARRAPSGSNGVHGS